MDEKRQRTLSFYLPILLGLALVVAGLLLGVWTLSETRRTALSSQDSQLMKAAQSVDNDILGHFRWYCSDLAYVTSRRGFRNAEEVWLVEGEGEDLLDNLRGTPLYQTEDITGLTASRNGEVLLSTDGDLSYRFSDPIGTLEDEIWVSLCENGAGRRFIALCLQHGEATYAALIDGEAFFTTTEEQSAAGERDRILLLDASGRLFLHRSAGEVRLERVTELEEGDLPMGLEQLRAAQAAGEVTTQFFQTVDEVTGRGFTARLSILPVGANGNGCFTVGVLNDYDATSQTLNRSLFRAIFSCTMAMVGLMLLFLCLFTARRENLQAEKEVAALRQKKEAVEALNQQIRELAHHQRLETIGTLTSSIAHEFNNLLAPIMGYSILALEHVSEEDSEVYDSLLEIYGASRKAKIITSRLSDLARKSAPSALQSVSPDEIMGKALDSARPAKPKQVELVTDLTCGQARLRGNETQLSQLLLNLILNAFRAMEGEGGTLTLSTRVEGEEAVLQVADTGPGIPPEVLPHIFEPFFTTMEGGRGTGLGLAIVQQVAEDHGGTVQVDTQMGVGTTFTVRLPLEKGEE